jgi:hypothetical protein
MKVEPDFPVPDDKTDFSVEPEKMAGGLIWKATDAPLEAKKPPPAPHYCKKPEFKDNSIYQYQRQYFEDVKRIPDGSLWQCEICDSVYEARTHRRTDGNFKRRWVKMLPWSFRIKARWESMHKT